MNARTSSRHSSKHGKDRRRVGGSRKPTEQTAGHNHRPSPNNILVNLPPGQLAQVIEWLVNNETYRSTQAKLRRQFGVTISEAGISQFWIRYIRPAVVERDELIRQHVRQLIQKKYAAIMAAASPEGMK